MTEPSSMRPQRQPPEEVEKRPLQSEQQRSGESEEMTQRAEEAEGRAPSRRADQLVDAVDGCRSTVEAEQPLAPRRVGLLVGAKEAEEQSEDKVG